MRFVTGWLARPRNLQLLALILAAPIATGLSAIYFFVLVSNRWDPSMQKLQLEIVRDVMMYIHMIIFFAIIALSAGLIRSIKANAGSKFGFEVDLLDEYDSPAGVLAPIAPIETVTITSSDETIADDDTTTKVE